MTSMTLDIHNHNNEPHHSTSFLVTTQSIPSHILIPTGTSTDLNSKKATHQIH